MSKSPRRKAIKRRRYQSKHAFRIAERKLARVTTRIRIMNRTLVFATDSVIAFGEAIRHAASAV